MFDQHHTKCSFITAVVLSVTTGVSLAVSRAVAQTVEERPTVLTSATAAVARAEAYSGFSTLHRRADAAPVSASEFLYRDSTTPFLSAQLDSQPAWRVHYEGISIDRCPTDSITGATMFWDFDVLLAARDGRLLRIEHRHAGFDPLVSPEPVDSAAASNFRSGGTIFYSLAVDTPDVKFGQILFTHYLYASPSGSKELIARYVLAKDGPRFDSIPLWVVTLKGYEPYEFGGMQKYRRRSDPWELSVCTNFFDSRNGRSLGATNLPWVRQDWKPENWPKH